MKPGKKVVKTDFKESSVYEFDTFILQLLAIRASFNSLIIREMIVKIN